MLTGTTTSTSINTIIIITIIIDIDKLEEELKQDLAHIESIFEGGDINITEGGKYLCYPLPLPLL